MKFLLSESLKHNQLPIWTDVIGTGFPLLGEGQIQALSLINLFLFKFFPLITAFNMQYVILFLGLSIGMYLVAREFGWSKVTALMCAIVYAFSGVHIVRIPHVNCLQALSYVPFLFWIILKMQKNRHSKLILLLPILLSQQILQGHYQYVFMTIIFLALYIYFMWWKPKKKDRAWIVKTMILVGVVAVGLAAGQLIPSFEYFLKSGGREGLSSNFIGQFKPAHLLQFFYPFILGDNRIGAYPTVTYQLGFHETFSYIGVLPILMALSSLFFLRKNTWVRNSWIIIFIFFLFVFEKNSPIYFLFLAPPFSWLRVHSRFLAFITFLLVLLAGFIFNEIDTWCHRHVRFAVKQLFLLLLVVICVGDVLWFSSSYQPALPASVLKEKPELFRLVPDNMRMTVLPYNSMPWFTYVYKNGWKHPKDYLYLVNGGQPNYSLLFHIPNLSIYAGFLPQKEQRLLFTALESSSIDQTAKTATLSALSINTLRLHNTGALITPLQVLNPEVTLVNQITSNNPDLQPFQLYTLSKVKPRYYLTTRYKKIRFVEEYIESAEKPDALENVDAFITTSHDLPPSETKGTIEQISHTDTKKQFRIHASSDSFFVASLYLYPGWVARLDGKAVAIEPANISGMAIFIPKGNHELRLTFVPKSLYLGLYISGGTLLFYGAYVIRSLIRARK